MRKTRTWIVFAALAIMGTACGSSAASTGTPSNTKDTASATDTSSSADTAAAADTAGADTVAGPNLDSKTPLASGTGFEVAWVSGRTSAVTGSGNMSTGYVQVEAKFDADGRLLGWGTDKLGGSATAATGDFGTVGGVAWGRYANGTFAPWAVDAPYGANDGFHYVSGLPTTLSTAPTSGTGTYKLVASTKPTIGDASVAPGTFTGGAKIAYAKSYPVLAFDLTVTLDGQTYTITTPGGLSDPSKSNVYNGYSATGGNFNTSMPLAVTTTSPLCATACKAGLSGFTVGPNADQIALVWNIAVGKTFINGASVWNKQ